MSARKHGRAFNARRKSNALEEDAIELEQSFYRQERDSPGYKGQISSFWTPALIQSHSHPFIKQGRICGMTLNDYYLKI